MFDKCSDIKQPECSLWFALRNTPSHMLFGVIRLQGNWKTTFKWQQQPLILLLDLEINFMAGYSMRVSVLLQGS